VLYRIMTTKRVNGDIQLSGQDKSNEIGTVIYSKEKLGTLKITTKEDGKKVDPPPGYVGIGEDARLLTLGEIKGKFGCNRNFKYIFKKEVGLLFYLALLVVFLLIIIKIMVTGIQILSDIKAQDNLQKTLLQRISLTTDSIKALELENEKNDKEINEFKPVLEATMKKIRKIETDIVKLAQHVMSPGYFHLALSCSNILQKNPTSASGYYFIRSASGQLRNVYCKMNGCGSSKGGWMRLAELNVTNCPVGLKSKKYKDIETCVAEEDDAGCTEWNYSNLNVPYSKVCGRIKAYMVGTPDGFHKQVGKPHLSANYVDGIVVHSRNTHIWSFVGGHCNCFDTNKLPPFVGKDWTCSNPWPKCFKRGEICLDKIIGDTQQCGADVDMFNKNLNSRNTDVSVKICRDSNVYDEDIALTLLEIYVQ